MKLGVRAVLAVMAVVGLQLGGCLDVDEAKAKFCEDNPELCDGGTPDSGRDAGDGGHDAGDSGPDAGDGGLEPGWHDAGTMLERRAFHTATRLNDGKVLVVGGSTSASFSGASATAEIFDPSSNSWSPTTSLQEPRARHTATLLGDGTVLVVGGHNQSGTALGSAVVYSPADGGSWSDAGSLKTARFNHDAVLLTSSGQVLVMGGGTDNNTSFPTAEIYNPTSREWTDAGMLSVERNRVVAVEISNDRVLAVGGFDNGERTADVYQISTKTWAPVIAQSAANRVGHTVTRLRGGDILVAGSDVDGSGTFDASAQLLSENNLALGWRSAGSLSPARGYHTATLLDTGDVLVTGGTYAKDSSLSSTKLYHPTTGASGSWTDGPSMSVERANHRATLLKNSGYVLITGGMANAGAVSSVELYVPPAPPP
ncbi:Kelch repeat-containing protein [Myxococcus landrumensis]|uniref:Galactose oxidase n=1 Tax=Myxococcus landrumensis TaxID=2813577 RepID=A0ABX7N2X2_9BACT|nr:kelch repeat-containing protein [Myxococcus landrumus]QSQ12052.1 galactose oxidase [Myxococcus landrumus]